MLLAGCSSADAPDPVAGTGAPGAADAPAAEAAAGAGDPLWLEGGRLRRSDGASWDQPLELDHIGHARIGDRFVDEDWLEEWVSLAGDAAGAGRCDQLRSDALPPGVSMLVLDGAISRFDLSSDGAATSMPYQAPFGLRLGQARAEALLAMPREVEVGAHEFQAPGRDYLTWLDSASRLGLRVETADGAVAAIRWGDAAAVMRPGSCA